MATARDEQPAWLVVDVRRACERRGVTGRDGTCCGGTGGGSASRVATGGQALDRIPVTGVVHA